MSVCIFVAVDCPYNITFCFIVISLPYSMANKKSRRIHLSQGVKSAGLFVFSEIVKYTRRSRLVYTQATKTRGIQRGGLPFGSGFPIGASSTPVGTRLCWQSIVCYTFASG